MTREEAISALRELLLENECHPLTAETLAHEYADDIARNFPDAAALRNDFLSVERMVERIALATIELENAGGKIH